MTDPDTQPGRLARLRARSGALDHVIRAYTRYQGDGGDRLAAAVTYFGFLSFFPLIALAVGVLTIVTSGDTGAVATVVQQVDQFSPGLAEALMLKKLLSDPAVAGAATGIGALGLLYAGTGWVDALRQAVRVLWHQEMRGGNLLLNKVKDIAVLVGLGLTLVASVVVSGLATAGTTFVLSFVDLEGSPPAALVLRVLGVLLPLAVDVGIFLYLFTRLSRRPGHVREVLRGALLGAVLLELLKLVGSLYISRTTANPVYGLFAVPIGLLVWINLVSRVALLVASWTVTGPYSDDVVPSGSAYPPAPSEQGPPAVAQGRPSLVPAGAVAGEAGTRTAAKVGVGVLVASAAGVAVYGVRTLRR